MGELTDQLNRLRSGGDPRGAATQQRARESLIVSAGTPVDRVAQARRDAQTLGIPVQAVLGDAAFGQDAQQARNDAALATAPKTAAFLADENNAAVAHDQVEPLSFLERTTGALKFGLNALAWQQRSQTLGVGAVARRLLGAAGAGVLRTSAGVVAMTEASDDVLDMLDPILAYERLTGRAGIATQAQTNRRQASRQFREDITASAGRFNPQTGNFVVDAALQGVESVVPSLTGMALAALTGGTSAPVVASAFLAAPQGGTSYAEARDAGRGVGQSLVYGVAQGATEYAGERLLGAGKLVERLALGRPLLRSILRNQLEEQIGEQATTVIQDLNQWATINPDKPFSDYLKERPNAALQTAIATAVGTAVSGGVVGAVTAPIREGVTQEARATDAVVDAKAFSDLEAQVSSSELMTRAPDALRGALDQMLDGKTVFVPGEKVVEFFQSNPDLDQWLDEWDIRDQVEQAAAAGTDVAFSQSDYLVRVAPTAAGAAFKPDLRFAIGAMSEREAADRAKAQQEGEADPVLALLDESIAKAQAANNAADPVERVQADVFSKLRAAGTTVDVAREQSAAVAARSQARAERRADRFPTAWDAYQANPLDVTQVIPERVRANMGRADVFLRALRESRAAPTQRRMLGRSLNEFLSANGGVYDAGGDLASMGLDQWHRGRPGVRKLLSDNNGSNGLDYALTRAIEGGYLRADATVDDLTAAMGEELRGRPTYSQGFERDLAGEENAAALNDFEQVLNTMGVDLSKETDAEVKAKLDKLANAVDGGETLNQNTGAPRGSISFTGNRQIITLMASADKSTFLHESGHAFLQELDDDARFPGASQQLIDDHNAVFEWFEKNDEKLAAYASKQSGQAITADDVRAWAAKRSMAAETDVESAIYTAAHEQWAETFEQYLMTGKSPSIRLRGSFERFSLWLKAIYNGITRTLPNAVITDDIRGVMDRLLATDEEIATARATMGLAQELEGMRGLMTPEAFSAFADAVQRAADVSRDDLLAQTMKAVRREKTAEWNALAAEIRPDIEAEVDAMPDIAAVRFLRENGQGLGREFVVTMLGNEAGIAMLPRGTGRGPVVRLNGLHPDVVAEAAGYPSGVAMLNGLMDMQAEKVAAKSRGIDGSVRSTRINDRIRETLLDRYGDILNDGTIAEEALAALHNEKQGEVNQIALTVLGRRVGQSPSPLSVLRAWARRHIGERPIAAARPDRFLQAERKAANAAAQAIAKDDRSEAYRQKQQQQANFVLYAAARQAREDVDKAVNRMMKLGRKKTIGSLDQDYLDQIHALLSQYDLRPASAREVAARQSLIDFVKEQEAAGRAVMIPSRLQAQAEKRHYSTLTVDQIRELDEAVANLVQLGKLKQTLKDGKERREKELIFQEAEDTANGNLKSKRRKDGFAAEEQLTAKMKASPQNFEASMVRIQEYFRRLQNGFDGVFTRMLDTPGQEAYEKLSDLRRSFWTTIRAAEKAIPDGVRARWFERLDNHPIINPETGQPFDSLVRQDLIGMAQHVGSVSNFEAFAKGWGVIPRNADEFAVEAGRLNFIQWLGTELNESEWDYVQAWWDAREQQREAYFENEREMTGIRPTPVEAAAFEVNGRKFAGGYATIVHDTRYDKNARDRDAQDMADPFGGITRRAKTSNGSANDRTGYVGPVDFRMKVAASSAHTQMVRIAYGQYIESAVEFLENDQVRRAIIDKLGRQAHTNMQEWLSDQVKDHGMPELANREADSFMRSARSNVAIGSMLWSFTTLASQLAGIAQSVGTVGIGTFMKGQALSSAMVARTGDPLAAVKFILSKSKYMDSRLNEGGLDASVRAATLAGEETFNPKLVVARGVSAKNRLKHAINVERSAKNNVAVVGSALIGFVDLVGASGAAWMGVYDNALVEGLDEEAAVRRANDAVVRAQGGSRPIDRSPLMRSKGQLQNLTMFFGWANAMYNVQRGAILDLRDGKNVAMSVQAIGWTIIIGPLMSAMLSGDAPWDDDEEGLFDWFMRNVLFGLGDSLVGVRDITNVAERKVQGKYAGDPGGTVIQRLYGTGKSLFDDIYAAALPDDEKEVSTKWPSHVISAVGYGLGWGGTAQASRTANYAVEVADDKQEPANIIDWVAGVLRGPQENQK